MFTEIQKILIASQVIATDLGHETVETQHLLLGILDENSDIADYFDKNFSITNFVIRDRIIQLFGTTDKQPTTVDYSETVNEILKKLDKNSTAYQLLLEILNTENIGREILKEMLSKDEYCELYTWVESYVYFTPIFEIDLDHYYLEDKLKNLSFATILSPASKEKVILKRDEEIKQIMVGLGCFEKSNIALTGNPGVGKTAIVEELSRILAYENELDFLKDYMIVELNTNSLIAGTKYRGEFEEKIDKYLKLIKDEKIITFIDEGHTIIGAGATAESSLGLNDMLKPVLARGEYKFILATTDKEYESIQKDAALSRRFRRVPIKESKKDDVYEMISNKVKQLEKHHNLSISKEDIDFIINQTSQIKHRFYPDKVIDVLDYTFSYSKVYGKQKFDLDYSKGYIKTLIKESKEIEIRKRNSKRKENILCQ